MTTPPRGAAAAIVSPMPAGDTLRPWIRIALILCIGLFWGGNWPAVKTILLEIPPFTLRTIGFGSGAALLLGWALLRGIPLRVRLVEMPWLLAASFLNILLFNVATAFAQLAIPTSQAAIITFTMPVWATVLAVLILKERPGARQWVGLALGLIGLGVVLGPEALQATGGAAYGPLLALLAAVAWASGTVVMKRRGVWISSIVVVTGWQYAIAAVPMIGMAVLTETPPALEDLQLSTWVGLGYHIVFSICIAQMLWFAIIKRVTVGQATVATLITPVVGVMGSVLLLGDSLTVRIGIALCLVLVSVACVMTGKRVKA